MAGIRGFGRPPIGPDLSRMEAWPLRKALLVVALVMASFAGGAAVNGPGLSWLKGLIGDRLHQGDAIPTLDVDDGPPVAVADAEPSPVAAPAAPAATAKPANSAPDDAPPALTTATASAPPSDPRVGDPAPAEPSPLPELPASSTPPAPAPAPSRPIDKTPAPNPAAGFEDAPGPAPETAVLPRTRPARDRAPMADSAVAAAAGTPAEPPPLSPSVPATTTTPAGTTGPADWGALRKRMKTLGVTRYWVEGSPSGAVTFRCVVPSGGPDAANRQFEAEADDEQQAAESALRRVAVWKAAERVKG